MKTIFHMRIFFLLIFISCIVLAEAQSIKVMTYNIRYDTPSDSVNQWTKRKEKVFTLIKKYNPDVLGIQEALHHQIEDLLQNLPAYEYVGVGRDDGTTKGEYAAILYRRDRYQVRETKTQWLSETPDVPGSKSWDAAITRIATLLKLTEKKSGKELFFINTHFDHIGVMAREKSAVLLKTYIDATDAKLPVIVTGDFNSERNEGAYQVMKTSSAVTLYDAKPTSDNQGTFCNFKMNSQPCKVIDYIFYSAAWKLVKYNVIQDNDGTCYPSDHLPVMAEFVIKK